jgi:hypothetical protein
MNQKLISLGLVVATVGCGSGDRMVTGRLDLTTLGRSEARMIAARANERIETPITADGRFASALPEGTWAIAYADTVANGGRVFANLVINAGATRSGRINITAGETAELGLVRPAPSTSPLSPADDDDNDGDDDDDNGDDGNEPGDDNGDDGNEPGDDNGGNGNEPGDDNGGDDIEIDDDSSDDHRDDCRGVDSSGGISLFANFLVTPEDSSGLDTAGQPDDDGGDLPDSDDDGRPDVVDEDHDGDDVCDDDGDSDSDDGDSDGGVPDAGEEDDEGEADLPYAVKLEIGDTFTLADAFAEKGAQPAEILSVEMEDGSWRLSEIRSLQSFTVDQSDCDHEGNRSRGRDRIFVSWRNTDGSLDVDHLDLRYCGQ